MKKIFLICLTIGLVSGMLFAGGNQEEQNGGGDVKVNPAGVFPIVDETLTIKVLAAGLHPSIVDISDNYVTRYMEENTNIRIEWNVIPGEADEAATKINLIMASGEDMPDLIMLGEEISSSQAQQMNWAEQGLITPIDDYLGSVTPELDALFARYPGGREAVTTQDGHTYGFGSFETCFHCEYSQKMWINKTWLDNLGLDIPETTEEFYQVLKAFKEQDPNGNGKADEIPLAGSNGDWHDNIDGFIMNSFIYNEGNEGNRLFVDNGKIVPVYTQDGWRDGLRYMRKLYSEKLIDSESFIQSPDQLKQLVEGEEIMLGAAPGGGPWHFSSLVGEATKNYVALPPLKGPKGVQYTGYYPGIGVSRDADFLITSNAKSPEAIMRWLDFAMSEEANFVRLRGEQGVDWRFAEAGEIGLNGKPAVWKDKMGVDIDEPQKVTWHGLPLSIWDESVGLGFVSDGDPWEIEGRLFRESSKYVGYEPEEFIVDGSLKFTLDEARTQDELGNQIIEYVEESLARFVLGDLDLDKDWDKYIAEFKNLELDTFISIQQAAFDRIK